MMRALTILCCMACLMINFRELAHRVAGSVNGEKRSQSLRPSDKQRSIDFQQPMLKMTRSDPPIVPARTLMDLNGAQPLKA